MDTSLEENKVMEIKCEFTKRGHVNHSTELSLTQVDKFQGYFPSSPEHRNDFVTPLQTRQASCPAKYGQRFYLKALAAPG